MTDEQRVRFHSISDRMSKVHRRMLQQPFQMCPSRPVGAQKAWLKMYDELCKIGTKKDR